MGEVYSHLSEEERQVIQIEIGNGTGIRAIGAMIGRSPSTVSREIKRNTWFPSNESESYRPYRPRRLKTGPWTSRYYIAGPAQRKAARRRAKARKPHRLSHDRLWAWVAERLGCGWSPPPVSGRLRVLFPGDDAMRVCPETVYRWIYSSKPRRERRARCLPRGHRRRRKHAGRRVSRFPYPRKGLHRRASAGGGRPQRVRPLGGRQRHRHGMRPAHRGRKEDPLPHGPCYPRQDRRAERRGAAGDVRPAAGGRQAQRHARQRHRVRPPRAAARRAGHGHVLRRPLFQLAAGSNENRNGLIRRYLPKRTIIEPGMARELQEIVDETDNRPMRALGYRTPAEAFADELPDLQL